MAYTYIKDYERAIDLQKIAVSVVTIINSVDVVNKKVEIN